MGEIENPLVSIIIPTYSRTDTLITSIDSALSQTYSPIEIIVVDDNPPDSDFRNSTISLMRKYEENKSVIYIKNSKNLGGARARNVGIKSAHGQYIAFLDDDDEYYPEKIEKQLNMFMSSNDNNLGIVFCDSLMTIGRDKFVCYVRPRYSGCCIYEAMRDNCLAATSQWLARKDILEEVKMFSDVPCKQDSQLILKILDAGYEVACVPEVLSKYCNYSGNRISGTGEKNLLGELLYRESCRKQYYRLTYDQIQEVEYSFAQRLFSIYKNLNKKKEYKNELSIMKKIHPFRAYDFLIHLLYYNIKDKVVSR